MRLRPLAVVASLCVTALGCADLDEGVGTSEDALASGSEEADHILFPGDPACGGGCERSLASDDLFIPARNGSPWGDTWSLGKARVDVAGGYSSGRIALLRRLALAPTAQRVAVLLDPSWNDGERNFAGAVTTGPKLVEQWLAGDPTRRFVLIHSTSSTGWAEYEALRQSAVGGRVRVCSVVAPHLEVPSVVGRGALLAPETWEGGRCAWGGTSAPPVVADLEGEVVGTTREACLAHPTHCLEDRRDASGAWSGAWTCWASGAHATGGQLCKAGRFCWESEGHAGSAPLCRALP